MNIARWTTPSITYKPSLTAVADIDESESASAVEPAVPAEETAGAGEKV